LLRERAFQKLANIYGWRYQVLAQRILSDRRGPVFHFPLRTLGFVTTEIGSPHWIPSHDVQDAALQKFGQSLPLELRQRLMDLGWTENDSLAGKSDWGQIPITSLPTFQYQQDGSGTTSEKSPSPARPLIRRASSGSGNSVSMRKRKVIFAPILMTTITEQADVLVNDPDGIVSTSLRELVKLLQREDSTAFLRPFTDAMTDNFAISLPRLNAFVIDPTPGFAYAALNALVGFVKTTLRNEYKFLSYSRALATISLLIPQVSEMSLRDIRKNKAEAVLLPASIHEDEAGFKLHAPWRDNSLSVQTAQLLVITEIFKANPREVYLIKKMLSNLQIQGSIQSLPFSRTWLVLIATLFQGVNRNYNDRAELRHFLQNIATILRLHGSRDVLIASHAMRVFILCSARFRRLFASMGFSTIMPSVCETYSSESFAIRDCIDYAARSFYRIHQDNFVYQTCVVIAEGESDPASAYDLLASLSTGNTISSGVSSGIRGMNDTEEVDALVQMMSGPEMANTEIGTAAAERQAQKIGAVSLDEVVFPRENIIRLLVTVIASDPSSPRARSFLRLFTGIVPHFTDPASQVLLRQGVEALGAVVVKGKAGEETARLTHHPGAHSTDSDWTSARREYIFLVESYTRSGGALGAEATRRTLEMVLGLLRRQPEAVGPAAASILGELAKTHLSGPKPVAFLRDIASLFRFFIAAVDFSGVLEQITSLIRRSGYDLDTETTAIVIEAYVEPAMRVLANASEKSLALALPFRMSAVTLLSAAVFLRGDALGAIERHPPSPGLLASVVLPFCLLLENPPDVDRDAVHSSLWIRLLHFVLRSPRHANRGPVASVDRQGVAAAAVVSLQIVKVIILRAPDSVSSVNGLWNYLAQHLLKTILDGDGRFLEMGALTQPAPRIVDWMMWSLFELLSLHRSPLHINFRYRMQTALAALQQCEAHSQPSTPGEGPRMASSPHVLGRARNPSGRSPSLAVHARMPSVPSPQQGTHSRMPSFANTPHLTPEHGGYSRMPSQNLSPLLSGHARIPSGANGRPTFADLSLRRASRPVFEAFPGGAGMLVRFPSSAPVRSGGGGAIVHLLGGPSQVLSATSSSFPTVTNAAAVGSERAVKDVRLSSEALKAGTRRAVRVCLMVFGYELEPEEDEEVVREWSVHDALVSRSTGRWSDFS